MKLSLKASAISCPRALFRFFARSFGDSFHPSCHANCCPKNSALLLRPESWHEIIRPLTTTSVLKTEFFFPISADEKGASGFRVLANHVPSFFSLTLSGDSFGLLSLSTRVKLWSTESLTYILISSFNGQHLGPVNSNTKG